MTKHNKIYLSLLLTFGIVSPSMADNEVYIDQVGGSTSIIVEQDGSGNTVSGESGVGDKMLVSGDNVSLNLLFSGGNNSFLGNLVGSDNTINLDVDGSGNTIAWEIDTANIFGSTGSDYDFTFTGGNNTFGFDIGNSSGADNGDFDFLLDGDFNTIDVKVDVGAFVLDWDIATSYSNIDYTASGYDGHTAIINGTGDYMDIDINQTSTMSADTIEVNLDGSGLSTSPSVICITQSDAGTTQSMCGN
jgi:hypothetical protein|tara:strand:+ start:3054 stop:3791 length:738 start_codon:yes stop_codon:yes gene_type:complete